MATDGFAVILTIDVAGHSGWPGSVSIREPGHYLSACSDVTVNSTTRSSPPIEFQLVMLYASRRDKIWTGFSASERVWLLTAARRITMCVDRASER